MGPLGKDPSVSITRHRTLFADVTPHSDTSATRTFAYSPDGKWLAYAQGET